MTGPFLLLACAFLITAFAPDSDIARALRRVLVVRPAEILNGGPLKVVVALIVLVGLILFAVAAPELVGLIGMADLSLYLDLAVLSFLLGAANGLKTASLRAVEAAGRFVGRLTVAPARLNRLRVRARRARKPRRGGSGDDSWPAGAWAAA